MQMNIWKEGHDTLRNEIRKLTFRAVTLRRNESAYLIVCLGDPIQKYFILMTQLSDLQSLESENS